MRPGCPERYEHEYIRHGTTTLIATFNVATGAVLTPSLGPTRTEEDFAAHIAQTVAADPDASWLFLVDNLNTHQSEALVRLVADGTLSTTAAREVFAAVLATGAEPADIVREKGLAQVSDEGAIAAAVDAVIAANGAAAAAVRAGNQRALGPLVGQVMKQMGGKANPGVVSRILTERIAQG